MYACVYATRVICCGWGLRDGCAHDGVDGREYLRYVCTLTLVLLETCPSLVPGQRLHRPCVPQQESVWPAVRDFRLSHSGPTPPSRPRLLQARGGWRGGHFSACAYLPPSRTIRSSAWECWLSYTSGEDLSQSQCLFTGIRSLLETVVYWSQ